MRKLHLLFALILVMSTTSVFSQYLSFKEGIKSTTETKTRPERNFLNGETAFIEISYKFTGANISKTSVNGEEYQFLHIGGFAQTTQVGAPSLPAHNEIIAMPENSTGKIIILNSEYFEYGGFNIHPALDPPVDTEGAPDPEFKKDEKIYTADKFFPQNIVEITDILMSRETPLAVAQVRPVQFNPVTGKIRVYTKIEYRLEFVGGTKSFSNVGEENSLVYTNLLKRNVINSESIPNGIPYKNYNSKAGEKNYIIITHSQYLTQANQLANWKRQMGYSVEVVSKSSWTAAQVKTEIHNRYNSWSPKPDYFVIIGDHTGSYAVPGEMHTAPDSSPFASDLYFACMGGGSDHVPDMAHGRISVSSAAEAQVIVDKIINYEENPTTNSGFYQNGLSCAMYQDDDNDGYADRRFCHTSENIRDYLQNQQGYTSDRVYYTSSTASVSSLRYNNGYYSTGGLLTSDLRSGSFNWNGGSSEITSEINSGKFFVFHRDHGYSGGSGWAHPYYTTSTMTSLSNGDLLPVVFSINCHTGEYQLSNCFAEKFLRMENKGAVGVVAAAYYSYSGFNDALAIGMIDAIWSDPGLYGVFGSGGTGNSYTIGAGNDLYTMGDVVNQGLIAMVQNWGDNTYQHELFHWFGDPAMKIWTSNPNTSPITATHSSTIDCAGSSFSISNSTAGATATLVFNDKLIGETVLNGSGNGSISYSINEPGATVILTISKHNHKPYVATLNVTGSCPFPPDVETNPATNVAVNSATGNGNIISDYGSVVTESGIVYSLNPNPEIGGAGVAKVQTSPVVTNGTFSVNLSALNSGTTYYFRAYAISGNGTGYGDDKSFTTGVPCTAIPYTQNFENSGNWPAGWSTGNANVWSLSTTWHGSNNPGGYHVYSDYTPYETGSVISPCFDGSGKYNVHMKFYHYWQANYSSGTQDGYLYGSRDGGQTYPYLIDEWHHNNPASEEAEKIYDISSWADGFDGLKFKWEVHHNNDWYWEFDNFEIYEGPVPGYWTGNSSNDWNNTGNWHDGNIPTGTVSVIIPGSCSSGNYPEVNTGSGAVCNNITIESGAHLWIPANNTLTVNGTLTNNAGTDGLVLKANSTGVASLINSTPNVVAKVQQHLSADAWHLVSVPITVAQSNIYLGLYLYDWSEPDSVFTNITTTSYSLDITHGYYAYSKSSVSSPTDIEFSGILNTGNKPVSWMTYTPQGYSRQDGWNLAGNPYPSGLKWDNTWSQSNLTPTVYVFDAAGSGNWLHFNHLSSVGNTLPNGEIPPAQGFFVLATAASPSMTIPNSARVHTSNQFYKDGEIEEDVFSIDITGTANSYYDQITFGINNEATDDFDNQHDAYKLMGFNEAPQLYSYNEGTKFSVDLFPEFTGSKSIPIGVKVGTSSEYSFNVEDLNNFNQSIFVYLEDKISGAFIDLRESPEYSFYAEAGQTESRFVLHFNTEAMNTGDNEIENAISVYSFGQNVYVNIPFDLTGNVSVYDMLGQQVITKKANGEGLMTIPVTNGTGYYVVKVRSDNNLITRKVFIK